MKPESLIHLMQVWGLSESEAANAFGVSRHVLLEWVRGVPIEEGPALASLVSATAMLESSVKLENIAAVIRRPADTLGGRSLLEVACAGDHTEVLRAVAEMFDLRRIQP